MQPLKDTLEESLFLIAGTIQTIINTIENITVFMLLEAELVYNCKAISNITKMLQPG